MRQRLRGRFFAAPGVCSLLLLVFASAGRTSEARAEEPARGVVATVGGSSGALTSADKDAARVLVAEADRRFGARDYAGALALYEQAYRRVHVPTVGMAVAKAQVALGLLLEARATALEVEGSPAQPGEPKVFAQARRDAVELGGRLRLRIPSVSIELVPEGVAARVRVDGVDAGSIDSTPLALNPGEHRVVASAAGYVDTEQAFELREGEPRRLRLALVAVRDEAVLTRASEAPASGTDSEQAAGGADAPGSAARLRGVVALGVAGVGVALGSTTGILAFTSKPDCPGDVCPAGSESSIRTSKRFGNVANVSFGVAALAGAYGLFELLVNAPSSGGGQSAGMTPGVAVVPANGQGGLLSCWGVF